MSAGHIFIPILTIVVFLSGCSTIYQPASVVIEDYQIAPKQKTDNYIDGLMQPYADRVNKNMNKVIAVAENKDGQEKRSDMPLASETDNIDLINGGYTHTFLDVPTVLKNKSGSDVLVNQAGWAGIVPEKLDFGFSKIKNKNLAKSHTVVIGKKTRE